MRNGAELVALGEAARRRRRLDDAAGHFRRAVEAFEDAGEWMRAAKAARCLAEVELEAGSIEAACSEIAAVLLFYRGREVPRLEMAHALRVAAMTDERKGFSNEARHLWGQARELYAREGVAARVTEAERRIRRLGNA